LDITGWKNSVEVVDHHGLLASVQVKMALKRITQGKCLEI